MPGVVLLTRELHRILNIITHWIVNRFDYREKPTRAKKMIGVMLGRAMQVAMNRVVISNEKIYLQGR
jgi:hypothetical protein